MSMGVLVAGRGWGEAVPVGVVVVACVGVKVGEGGLVEVVELQAALSSTGRSDRTSKQADFLIRSILAQMTGPEPGASW
jgi:hypothetical protein